MEGEREGPGRGEVMLVYEVNLYIPKVHLRECKLPIMRKTNKKVRMENSTRWCDLSHYFLIEPLHRVSASSLCCIAASFIASFSVHIYLLKKKGKEKKKETHTTRLPSVCYC